MFDFNQLSACSIWVISRLDFWSCLIWLKQSYQSNFRNCCNEHGQHQHIQFTQPHTATTRNKKGNPRKSKGPAAALSSSQEHNHPIIKMQYTITSILWNPLKFRVYRDSNSCSLHAQNLPPFLGAVGEGDNMKCQQNEQMYEYSIIIPMDIPHRKSNILAPCKYSV